MNRVHTHSLIHFLTPIHTQTRMTSSGLSWFGQMIFSLTIMQQPPVRPDKEYKRKKRSPPLSSPLALGKAFHPPCSKSQAFDMETLVFQLRPVCQKKQKTISFHILFPRQNGHMGWVHFTITSLDAHFAKAIHQLEWAFSLDEGVYSKRSSHRNLTHGLQFTLSKQPREKDYAFLRPFTYFSQSYYRSTQRFELVEQSLRLSIAKESDDESMHHMDSDIGD